MEQSNTGAAIVTVSFLVLAVLVWLVLMLWRPTWGQGAIVWLGAIVEQALPRHWTGLTIIQFGLLCFAALFLAIALHELGHAVMGSCVGFRFNSLRVGPVQFDRPFRISRYRGRGTGSGGWVSLLPVKLDKLIVRAILMLLAGPAANLLSIWVVFLLPNRRGPAWLWFVYWSLLLGSVNLLPVRSRAVISDGGRILMLLQNRARGERWLAMLKLIAELQSGVAYEKLTPGCLAKAVAIEDKSPDTVVGHALAYVSAFWQHKDDEAAKALETCLRHANVVAPATRHGLMSDAAVFQARRRKRIDLAEQWLADLPEKNEYPWMRLRGEAAILEGKGDIAGALTKLDEIEKMISAAPNQALREMSLRGLLRWKAELQP